MQFFQAQMSDDFISASRYIFQRKNRKVQAIQLAVLGVYRCRTRGTEATSEGVDTDDEMNIGVQRQTRPDHILPPAGCAVFDRRGSVRGRLQSSEKHDRVIAFLVNFTPGFESNGRRFEVTTPMHGKASFDLHDFSSCRHNRFISVANIFHQTGWSLSALHVFHQALSFL